MKRFLCGLMVLAMAATVLAEGDTPEKNDEKTEAEKYPVVDSSEAKKLIDSFKRTFNGTKDIDLQLTAVTKLAKNRHEKIVRELIKLMKHEDPFVGVEAMKGLANQVPFKKTIARRLSKWLEEKETDPTVVAQTIKTAGILDARNLEEDIIDLMFSDDDGVAIGAVTVLAQWRSYKALSDLLMLWEFYPDDGKWVTGSVTVDTGASGDTDQRAAKAKWKSKYGNKAKRGRPELVGAIRKGVNQIIGIEGEEKMLKQAPELREWMKENKELLRRHR